jgi:iron complex outermembrane receptor protein
MVRTVLRRLAGAFAAVLAAAAPAAAAPHADPVAPPIAGVVRDAQGTPLPNVQVHIVEINRSTTTAADGSFGFRALRPGTYHLDATLLGYAPGHAVVTVPENGPEVRVAITLAPTPLAIEGINVTASPGSADPLNITQSTLEISGKQLDRKVGTSVAQTLAGEPGMSVRYAGPAASTPVIRGLSGERVLVLQNGQRTADLSSTSADHALSVDPLAANRVEVVRGPASLLYGNNALGGVVNVLSGDIPTSLPGHLEGFVAGQGESVNPGGALSASITAPVGSSVAVTARGGFRHTDDVRTGDGTLGNTFYRNRYGVGGIGYVGERASGGLSFGAYGFRYGLPAAADAEEQGISIEGERFEGTGRLDLALGERGFTALRLDGTAQRYSHDEIEDTGEVGTRFKLDTETLGLTAKTRFGALNGAVGVSALFKRYAPEGEEALTPEADSRNAGVFLYQELALGGGELAPRLQAGARYDWYRVEAAESDDFGPARARDFRSVSGSVGLSVPLSSTISANVSAARAFRAPTVEELYADGVHHAAGSYDVGDPTLAKETNRGVEAVLRAQTSRVNAQLSGFYNRIDDFIHTEFDGTVLVPGEEEGEEEELPLARYVQADATLRGVEASAEAALSSRFVLGAMGDYVRGTFRGGGDLPFIPAGRVGGSARWDDGKLSAGVEVRHAFAQDRVSQPDCAGIEEACVDVATDAYTLANVSAGIRLIRGQLVHSVTLRVDNLLDETYFDAASRIKSFAPNPGRNLALVYRVLF